MPKRPRRKVILLIVSGLLVAGVFLLRPILLIATGYSAKHACSCHFFQGRSLEDISKEDLNFSVLPQVGLSLTDDQGGVQASILGLFRREARYTTGQGCTLINDASIPLSNLAPTPLPTSDSIAQDIDFNLALSDSLGVDGTRLAQAVDFGMAPVEGGAARALLVIKNGQLLAESYAEGYDENSLLLGWSMTKSITGLLVGMAGLQADQDHLFPEWENDERSNITIDNLLTMSSGLKWTERYGASTHATHMLHRTPDFAAYARSQPKVAEPGEQFIYSSGTSNMLMQLYLESFPTYQEGIDFMYERLFHAIGANSFRIETDQSGKPVGSSYGWATARDWARVGQLVLQNGRWGSDQIVDGEWIDYLRKSVCTRPEHVPGKAESEECNYGGHFWLKSIAEPNMPDDAILMRGFQDQRVIILPTQNMLIVRLGHNKDKAFDFDGLVERVLQSLN
ncbi:MAG: serine hydrolase [Bacteroidota bacterium]